MLKHILIIISLSFTVNVFADVDTYDSLFNWPKSQKSQIKDPTKIALVRSFMKMCLNPSPSQQFTLDAIAKSHFSVTLKNVTDTHTKCAEISERYIEDKKFHAILIGGNNIADLSPLKYLTGVATLTLSDNKISDITPLSKLVNLRELALSGNPITDISPLGNLKNLEILSTYNDSLIDINPIGRIKSLKSLSISANNKNKEILKNLTNLETLALAGVTEKLCYIGELTKLETLYLTNTGTKDISCLSTLKNLKIIHLVNLPVTDISVISNFTKLEDIDIKESAVEDISVLKPLKHLRSVRIIDTKVTDASPVSGKKLDNFDAYKSSLRWCSPKKWKDIIAGKSCYEKDGSLKSWWKRLFGI